MMIGVGRPGLDLGRIYADGTAEFWGVYSITGKLFHDSRIDPAVGTSLGPAVPNWWALRDNVISLVRPTIFRETEPKQCRIPNFMGNHWSDYAPARTNCTWSRRVRRDEI